MTVYSKFNIVYHLQKWMDSVPGQTFLNYAYSWGASIVILGTLFKLTHLQGANLMLFIGMGTEVFVFFLSAFDRPFDKTQDGRDLPTHIDEEAIDREEAVAEARYAAARQGVYAEGSAPMGTTMTTATGDTVQAATIAGLAESNEVAAKLADAQAAYLEQLGNLTETLKKVAEQSTRLTRDSEEMENLNRTLTGICKVYEMQLKGASQQIGTIDQINDQSRRMAGQIEQLNAIYARMIEAMTVNMNLKVKE